MNRQALAVRTGKWILLLFLLLAFAAAGLKLLYPFPYRKEIDRWASEYSIDSSLVAALIWTESHFRPHAVSSAGAIGLMQIMPATGEWIAGKLNVEAFTATNLNDPGTNIRFGAWYLGYLIDRFGDIDTALIAYNAGPRNAERWRENADEMFPETTEYVSRAMEAARAYRLLYTLPVIGPFFRALPL